MKALLLIFLLLSGCITTNYYTARTLEKGKTVLTGGVDNLIWIEEDGGVVDKNLSFSLSLGVATGLPWRFETGIRGYFPYIYEVNLRHQLNPREFDWFDISANGHIGVVFSEEFEEVSDPYFKYGLTISKEIFSIQPYVSYYLNKGYLVDNGSDDISDYSIICFGLAIPYKDDLIFPECNYYLDKYAKNGFFTFGIGIRKSLNKEEIPRSHLNKR